MSKTKRRMHLATPCENRWEELEPRGEGRYCAECDRVVVDLMHLRAEEAWRRFDAVGGDLCARVREDPRGDVVFRYEPSVRRGVGAVVLGAALAACGAGSEEPPPAPAVTAPAAPVATPVPTPEAPAVVTPEPPAPALPEDFHVLGEADGSDHPAHEGDPHATAHHRDYGRMGGISARDLNDDPLGTLEGL